MDLTLKPRSTGPGYSVCSGDRIIGVVKQVERYGVRGKRMRWEAYRLGKSIGLADTRKDAVQLLDRPLQKPAA
jgi:hypothetical protein